MKITGTQKDLDLIVQFCHVALKSDGIKNLDGVNLILASMGADDGNRKADLEPPTGEQEIKAGMSKSRGRTQNPEDTKQGVTK